ATLRRSIKIVKTVWQRGVKNPSLVSSSFCQP
ncbi:glutathione S-transferase, C-terminal domain protein, partial [Vibrio parahaemolyticus V-223/04]